MKRKIVCSLLACILCCSLTACSLPFGLGKKDEEQAPTEETTEAPEETVDTGETVTQEAEPLINYISEVASLGDPYSGNIGIGTLVVNSGSTYPMVAANLQSNYKLLYTKVDNKDGVEMPDGETVPEIGLVAAGFAPEGVTNIADPQVLVFEFAAPYDAVDNPNHKNVNGVKLKDFKIASVRCCVYDPDNNFTGNNLTVPGYMQAVLTKSDLTSAFGGATGEYLAADMTSAIKFYKEGTCFSDVTSEYNAENNLTKVELTYDVNYGVDISSLKAANDPNDITFDISAYTDFIENDLTDGQYYGFYQKDGKAKCMFVSAFEDVDQNTYGAYATTVYVAGEDGTMYNYADLVSSAVDLLPIKIDTRGNLYCAAVGQVACFSIDTEEGKLVLEGMGTKFEADDGSIMYNYGEDDTDDSSVYDDLMKQYDHAMPITMYAR